MHLPGDRTAAGKKCGLHSRIAHLNTIEKAEMMSNTNKIHDFPFSVNLLRQNGVSFSLFGAPLECNGVLFSLLGAPWECNGAAFSVLGISRRQRHGVYCSLLNCAYAPDRTEEDDPQSAVRLGLFNSCRSGVQIGLLNFNETGFLPVFPLFAFSTKKGTADSDPSATP